MRKTPMPFVQKALISDIDNTLIGDEKGLQKLIAAIKNSNEPIAFGVATGRTLESTIRVLKKWRVPMPDVLITSVGSEIHYWPTQKQDTAWRHHISHNWRRDDLAEAMTAVPGLRLQPEENQREFKLSYYVIPDKMPPLRKIYRMLRERQLQANLVYSHQAYLDVLPERASKGRAIRFLSYKWGVPLQNFLVAGDSGNDEEMLVGDTLGIVVGNHSPELEPLRGQEQIYFADHVCANGILEGLEHYGFLQDDETSEEVYP
jgi:sucrose-phosphate synthase